MRRRITFRGQSAHAIMRQRDHERDRLRERFDADPAVLARFVDYLISSGWDTQSIESTVKQYANYDRPPIQVFLTNGSTLLDQLLINQGTYTNFADTAADPNFAIRFKPETETVMRRITPGDTLLLHAAHRVLALYPDMQDDSDDYWRLIWQAIYQGIYKEPVTGDIVNRPVEQMYADPWVACAASFAACVSISTEDSVYEIARTFFDTRSICYVGVSLQREQMRQPDSDVYKPSVTFSRVDRLENLWMAASVLLCYAVDTYARDCTKYNTLLNPWFDFTDPVRSHFARNMPVPYTKCAIGDTDGNTSSFHTTGD